MTNFDSKINFRACFLYHEALLMDFILDFFFSFHWSDYLFSTTANPQIVTPHWEGCKVDFSTKLGAKTVEFCRLCLLSLDMQNEFFWQKSLLFFSVHSALWAKRVVRTNKNESSFKSARKVNASLRDIIKWMGCRELWCGGIKSHSHAKFSLH